MLSHPPHLTPAAPLAGASIFSLLELMNQPQEIRKLILDARAAEEAARKAMAELGVVQKNIANAEATNAAKAAELAEAERKLGEDRSRMESDVVAIKAKLAEERRKVEADREGLRERDARLQSEERAVAERKLNLDNRETVLAANEKALEAHRASLEEVAAMLQAKGLGGGNQ